MHISIFTYTVHKIDQCPVHVSIGIICVSGSDNNTDLELYNGSANLYLQVKQVEHGYQVEVAERPLVSNTCVTACIIP